MTAGAGTVQAATPKADQRHLDLAPGVTVRWLGGLYEIAALQGPWVHLRTLDNQGEDALALVPR